MSPAGEPLELVLYGRRDCGLCDEMAEAVTALGGGRVRLSHVDIDDDQDLVRRFGADIPVLCFRGEVVSRHFLDEARLARLLEASY